MENLISKLKLISIILLSFHNPAFAQDYATINVNRVCSTIVNIPYASDNFTDEEWDQFKQCMNFIKSFDNVE